MVILNTDAAVALKKKLDMLAIFDKKTFEEKVIRIISLNMEKVAEVKGWRRTSTFGYTETANFDEHAEMSKQGDQLEKIILTVAGLVGKVMIPRFEINSEYTANKELNVGNRVVLSCNMKLNMRQFVKEEDIYNSKVFTDKVENCAEYSGSGGIEVYRNGVKKRQFELSLQQCLHSCDMNAIIGKVNALVSKIARQEILLEKGRLVKCGTEISAIVRNRDEKKLGNEQIETVVRLKEVHNSKW